MVALVNTSNEKSKGSIWATPAIAATFIGTVIGAGFASGQEIYQFFSIYNIYGFLGIVLAIILMGWAGVKVFKIGRKLQPKSYQEFLVFILGRRLTPITDFLLFCFFVVLIGVMFAGSGSIFESIGDNYWTGVLLTGFLLIGVLFFELPGLVSANLIVIPLMFIGSIGISLYAGFTRCATSVAGPFQMNWFPAALQFSAYNLVLAIPVLISLAKEYPYPRWLKYGSWLGSIGLGIMAGFIQWALLCHLSHLEKSALPMVELAKLVGKFPYWVYVGILWGEMFTTLLANTYGITQRLVALSKWPYRIWLVVITITGIIIAQVGFINLIAGCYPVFGYLCLIILVLLLKKRV
jgi:uncharacterized membrane protein YkvI